MWKVWPWYPRPGYWNWVKIWEKSALLQRILPGNTAGKFSPSAMSSLPETVHWEAGAVLAVGCCLLVSSEKDWKSSFSPRSQQVHRSRVVSPLALEVVLVWKKLQLLCLKMTGLYNDLLCSLFHFFLFHIQCSHFISFMFSNFSISLFFFMFFLKPLSSIVEKLLYTYIYT